MSHLFATGSTDGGSVSKVGPPGKSTVMDGVRMSQSEKHSGNNDVLLIHLRNRCQ